METLKLPPDFKEFLKLPGDHRVEYLLIGGYADLFLREGAIVRIGVPPMRIEISNQLSGVQFAECYARRVVDEIDGVQVSLISLEDLKTNKRAAGRLKDLADLENLP
jgi:hypothetical protein